jgi:hypothetical protein
MVVAGVMPRQVVMARDLVRSRTGSPWCGGYQESSSDQPSPFHHPTHSLPRLGQFAQIAIHFGHYEVDRDPSRARYPHRRR